MDTFFMEVLHYPVLYLTKVAAALVAFSTVPEVGLHSFCFIKLEI